MRTNLFAEFSVLFDCFIAALQTGHGWASGTTIARMPCFTGEALYLWAMNLRNEEIVEFCSSLYIPSGTSCSCHTWPLLKAISRTRLSDA